MIEDYEDIKEGMTLRCISEDYTGTVEKRNGALYTDCCGWGWEPVSELDLDDIEIVE